MVTQTEHFDIHPRLVLHVGMIAIQWARIEWTLQKLAIGLLGADGAIGLVLTANLGFRTIQEFIGAALEAEPLKGTQLADDLSALVADAQRLLGIRNGLVHNIWPSPRDEPVFISLAARFKGKIKLQEETWTEAQLEALVQELVDLLEALGMLGIKHNLFAPMDAWETRATSSGTPAQRLPAQLPARSPKTTEVVSRLLSSRE